MPRWLGAGLRADGSGRSEGADGIAGRFGQAEAALASREWSVFGAGLLVAPDEPVELAEEVGVVVRAARQGPIFGHRRPSQ